MSLETFTQSIQERFPIGYQFINPGGGLSQIVSFSDKYLYYLRGKTKIPVTFENLYRAYVNFRGTNVSTSDLKIFAPEVFDSNARPGGHSCNCTFLFLTLSELGLSSKIQGRGVRGNPYYVTVHT